MAEIKVAAMATPDTKSPTTKSVISFIGRSFQHECAERKNRRHPKTNVQTLFLVAGEPEVNRQEKRHTSGEDIQRLGLRSARHGIPF